MRKKLKNICLGYHQKGQYELAEKAYLEYLSKYPNDYFVAHNFIILLIQRNKYAEALPRLRELVANTNNEKQYVITYIKVLAILHFLPELKTLIAQIIELSQIDTEIDRIQQAIEFRDPPKNEIQNITSLLDENRHATVIQNAKKTVSKFPFSAVVHSCMLRAYLAVEDFINAEATGTRIINLSGGSAESFFCLGVAKLKLEKLAEAESCFKNSLEMNANLGEVHYFLGVTYSHKKDFKNAKRCYESALNLRFVSDELHHNFGLLFEKERDYENSRQQFQLAIELNAGNLKYHCSLARIYIALGQFEDGLKRFRHALEIKPNCGNIIWQLISLQIEMPNEEIIKVDDVNPASLDFEAPLDKSKLYINLAIYYFLNVDWQSCETFLSHYKNMRTELNNLEKSVTQFGDAYFIFLSALLKEYSSEGVPTASSRIYHVGDSHSLSFNRNLLEIENIKYQISPKLVFGVKAFHLGEEVCNSFKRHFQNHFSTVPEGSILFVSAGEIDCRSDEGFIIASEKQKVDVYTLIDNTVDRYVRFIHELNKKYCHRVFFIEVPAPVILKNETSEVSNLRLKIITYFNKKLMKLTREYKFSILRTQSLTSGHNGFSNHTYHVDAFHLGQNMLPKLQEQINRYNM